MTLAPALPAPRAAKALSLEAAIAVALALFLALAAGNRWFGVGRDYLLYVDFYDRLGLATNITEERFEPGFTFGAWLFKFGLGLPYAAYATTLVAGALASKFALFFRHCSQPLLACLVYCAAFYPLHEYTQLRVAVGLAFAMPGAVAAVRGRPALGGLLILAGATFQSSVVVVGLGVGIALLLRLRQPVLLLLCGLLVLVVQALVPDDPIALLTKFNPLAQDYISQINAEAPNFFSVANVGVIAVTMLAYVAAIRSNDRVLKMAVIMTTLSVASLGILSDIPTFAFRFRELFSVFVILVAYRGNYRLAPFASVGYACASAYILHQAIADGLVS